MLEARDVVCIRDEHVLFSALSFTAGPGEMVQIAGANGVGKTSLLRILSGLATPESGDVCWQGQRINRIREHFNQQLLWLGHQPGIKSVLTGEENLRFFSPQQHQDAHWQALAAVGLSGYEDVPVARLSAGQQRRVALARLWLTDVPLWILDEPLTALDVAGVEMLTQRMEHHIAHGGIIILTTHQPLRPFAQSIRCIQLTPSEGAP
ncbi:cytochrome c biogenesis heme-transporting ATPase CcmA [Pectobacterium parmentieri]|uniref:Cytochrome c biogenesis ATP-binding export protein CcmA n=1 Tax=Pectobacterium parmentieri TaxID=1905730 RepID=A0A0H3I436_PECPM|nr:cytochrome c biogenesis heme-transporting ATPase CcmA [Pectobacterium parmentieri]AFI90793.1 Cytochrome c biogenesis ATP-binding export protein CcmA [Pectobacterium parmentieri]AOR58261.1 heme ABC transporter ATP-binding protein CcmA [Pectobacterium parmentieri]AYH01908.1 cytochrome c biogenesis heme-transporting ATPase CcmA [Pectobacterium parmentieri]AYH10727.1 cytochrome c biogenesis heme-transporting ATPase CcmA [Pectobacterium parmentieri]AYH18562.1 cytochrome c biogenesis heme-transpo